MREKIVSLILKIKGSGYFVHLCLIICNQSV